MIFVLAVLIVTNTHTRRHAQTHRHRHTQKHAQPNYFNLPNMCDEGNKVVSDQKYNNSFIESENS